MKVLLALAGILILSMSCFGQLEETLAKVNVYPEAPQPQFMSSGLNRALVLNEFAARGLDAMTTRINLSNSCHCYSEQYPGMHAIAGNGPALYAFSFGVAFGLTATSEWLWNTSHRKSHPKLRRALARSLLLLDGTQETIMYVHNSMIMSPDPNI